MSVINCPERLRLIMVIDIGGRQRLSTCNNSPSLHSHLYVTKEVSLGASNILSKINLLLAKATTDITTQANTMRTRRLRSSVRWSQKDISFSGASSLFIFFFLRSATKSKNMNCKFNKLIQSRKHDFEAFKLSPI